MRKKSRVHGFNFSPAAEALWRLINKDKPLPRGWLSHFVSDCFLKKFSQPSCRKALAAEMIRLAEVKRSDIKKEISDWQKILDET